MAFDARRASSTRDLTSLLMVAGLLASVSFAVEWFARRSILVLPFDRLVLPSGQVASALFIVGVAWACRGPLIGWVGAALAGFLLGVFLASRNADSSHSPCRAARNGRGPRPACLAPDACGSAWSSSRRSAPSARSASRSRRSRRARRRARPLRQSPALDRRRDRRSRRRLDRRRDRRARRRLFRLHDRRSSVSASGRWATCSETRARREASGSAWPRRALPGRRSLVTPSSASVRGGRSPGSMMREAPDRATTWTHRWRSRRSSDSLASSCCCRGPGVRAPPFGGSFDAPAGRQERLPCSAMGHCSPRPPPWARRWTTRARHLRSRSCSPWRSVPALARVRKHRHRRRSSDLACRDLGQADIPGHECPTARVRPHSLIRPGALAA